MIPGMYRGGRRVYAGRPQALAGDPGGGGVRALSREGAKMAGPAPALGPEAGRTAGPTAACERGRRPWPSRAAADGAGRVAGFGPLPLRGPFLLAAPPPARERAPPASANLRAPVGAKLPSAGAHAPSARGLFFLIKNFFGEITGSGEGSVAKHLLPFGGGGGGVKFVVLFFLTEMFGEREF